MRVDKYHDEDAAPIAELLAALPELPSTSAEAFRAYAAQSFNCGAQDFRVVRANAQILALLTSTRLHARRTPLRHFRIIVHPAHRRRGIATRLMEELVSQGVPTGGLLQCNSQRSWVAGNVFLERDRFGIVQSEKLMRLKTASTVSPPPATDSIAIRHALPRDDLAWMKLHRLAYQGHDDFSELVPGDLVSHRASPGFALLVAESHGDVLGYCHVIHLDSSEGLINSLVVRDESQGRGLGQLLLDRALTHLWQDGVAKISLNVVSEHERAIRIYERAGFRTYDEILRFQRSVESM